MLLALAVVCVCAVLSVIVLVLQDLRSRLDPRVDHLAACRHLGDLLEDHCVVDCVVRIGAPGEGTVVLAEDCRNCFIVQTILLEVIRDQDAGMGI